MTIVTRDLAVEVVEDGVARRLTRTLLAESVLAAVGGGAELRGEGVPAGGAVGQMLAKRSAADHDVQWVDPASAPPPRSLGAFRHGSVPGALRPSGYTTVMWVGSVPPANAQSGDLWFVG
jgi:hypothetical protein